MFDLEPLQQYLPEKNAKWNDQTLKKVVRNILTDSDENLAAVQEALLKMPKSEFGDQKYIPEMLPRLQEQYDKTDPGNLVAL